MNTAIYSFITKHTLIIPGETIIVGLSGGPDSVFLLHTLHQLRERLSCTLIAVHLNHGWRVDAHEDELFCKNLCLELNIPFESMRAQELPLIINKKKSLEEQGRLLRRTFFEQMKKKYNATKIALGHHQDDQIETFFIRLIRGASLEGLSSIKPLHNGYIRPLLDTKKEDILSYLHENNIPYQTDSTNESPLFLRNRLRKLLPLLSECDNRFTTNTLKAINHIQQSYAEIDGIVQEKYLQIVDICHNKKELDILLLKKETVFFQKHILSKWLSAHELYSLSTMSNSFFDEILRFLLNNRGGRHQLHKQWVIFKKSHKAYIAGPQILGIL